MSSRRQANALLGLQGLDANANARVAQATPVEAEASMSLSEFTRAVRSSKSGNNESRLVSHGNHALANRLDALLVPVPATEAEHNGSFWGEGDNMSINISLGTGRVTVGPKS